MTTAITYQNGTASIPWVYPLHDEKPRGVAFETPTHFVHYYADDSWLWGIHIGMMATEAKTGTLIDWAHRVFGAQNIEKMALPPGAVADATWRPGLYFEKDVFQALDTGRVQRRAAEQSLHGLVHRLSELLLFIEPEGHGLDAYSARSRELLILACTEVENLWTQYMRRAGVTAKGRGYTTRDYVRLVNPLYLEEFQVSLAPYSHVPKIRPFSGWNAGRPTQSLPWYDAYNRTKHDRASYLCDATLRRCIEAVAAAVILFCVRYSPSPLYEQATPVASLVSHLFELELVDCSPTTFYVPRIQLPANHAPGFSLGQGTSYMRSWTVHPLVV